MNDSNFRLCPVRPNSNQGDDSFPLCEPCGPEEQGWESIQDSHIEPACGGVKGDGEDDVIDIDDDSVVQKAKALPEPILPSRSVIDVHNLTHWPYRSWCPHCVAARRANTPHRRQANSARRTAPLLVTDHCFVRDLEDKELMKVLVCKMEPANL